MPSDRWTTEYFDEQFAEEDPWDFESSTYEQQKYRRQIRVLAEHGPQIDTILELGCAEGIHSELLLEAFPEARLTGIDISEQAIQRARERVETDRATFIAGDIGTEVETVAGSFDVVVWSETIYYLGDSLSVPEMYDVIAAVADLITDGGLLCLANIVDQEDAPETPLTREPILSAYHQMLEAHLDQVHGAEYTEAKEDREHTYWIWAFQK